jgi:sugar phosphate isomerase/epimerase
MGLMSWHYAASTGCCVDRPIVLTLDALHRGGVCAVELGTPPHHFDPWHHKQVMDVCHHLKQWSIQPVAIHAPFGGLLDLTDPNPHHRYAAIGAILTAAAALREMGGTRVVVHVSDVPRAHQNVGERLACGAQALRVLARACGQMHTTLVVETPLPHLIGGHPDEFASVVGGLDRSVGVCFDTSHITLGHHWDRLMELVGERLVHVHANDHRGHSDDHLPPGDGIIDWAHIRETLHQVEFEGWIVLELVCAIESAPTYVGDAMRRTEELLR